MNYYFALKNTLYIMQIENTKLEKVEGDMPYEYTLTAYKENGKKNKII